MFADVATVAIGIAVLLFTIFSTWYMYWRRGRLVAGRIAAFMAGVAFEGGKTLPLIGVPLRLINVGARPLVIERLRLRLIFDAGPTFFVLGRTEKDMLQTETDRNWLPLPFAVNPNESKHLDCIFELRDMSLQYAAKNYQAVLEARYTENSRWHPLLSFEMRFARADVMTLYNLNNQFRAYPIHDTV